jgi:ubiquinone/menaquinone biosynthesis C-methylase UbiE
MAQKRSSSGKKRYTPVSGVQQRRRLLKKIGQEKIGQRPFVSPRDVRRSVGKMFGFTPITAVTGLERSLLKKLSAWGIRESMKKQNQVALGLASGQLGLKKVTSKGRGIKTTSAAMRTFFSDGKAIKELKVIQRKPGANSSSITPGSRGLKGYLHEGGIDVLKMAREQHRQTGRPVAVLDVGSATAKMLSELKQKMGNKVETHALTPIDLPRERGVDAYHMLTAEYLPQALKGKFGVIVSNRALEYVPMVGVAVKNIAECLAPGGVAKIEFRSARLYGSTKEHLTLLRKILLSPRYSVVTPRAKRLLVEGVKFLKGVELTPKQLKEWLGKISGQGWFGRNMAYLDAIAKLRESKRFDVKVEGWNITGTPCTPGRVIITRKKS